MQNDVLKTALERGIVNDEQAEALRKLAVELTGEGGAADEKVIAPRTDQLGAGSRDDEDLKFVGGFGDIFVTIGLGLFLGALGYFASKIGGAIGTPNIAGVEAACFVLAGATWVLAEYFTRKRRMALPSIVMLIVFVVSCFCFFGTLFSGDKVEHLFNVTPEADMAQRLAVFGRIAATCVVTALLAGVYYWRFRVPIAVAGGVAVLCGIILSLVAAIAPEFAKENIRYFFLVCGLSVFALAMRFDMSDTLRRTRRTDIAFWLHMLAAPLIVHPILNPIAVQSELGVGQAAIIIAVFLTLGFVAVLIDRRAVLVSSLTYAGYSFGALVKHAGYAGEIVPLTLLVLGSFILLISVGWHPMRRLILAQLPSDLTQRLHNPYEGLQTHTLSGKTA